MKQIINSELKKIENDILLYIKEICDKNQIKYYLAYGTLLGAVRHRGFIPWDDDIDICMFREDYNKFRAIIGSCTDSQYKLVYVDTEKKYSLPLPKVIDTTTYLIQNYQRETFSLGVYVDIFILDNLPRNKTKRKFHIFKLNLLSKFWCGAQNKITNDKLTKNICKRILWIIGPRFFAQKIDKLAKKYNNSITFLCGNMTFSPDRFKSVMPRSFFGNGQILEFERSSYTVPDKYKDYLAQLYDDYMTFPPVKERVSLHDFTAYYL